MGDLACGMHNSVSGMIKNALVRIKKKEFKKNSCILSLYLYDCSSPSALRICLVFIESLKDCKKGVLDSLAWQGCKCL